MKYTEIYINKDSNNIYIFFKRESYGQTKRFIS